MCLALGGEVELILPGGQTKSLAGPAALPAEEFRVRKVSLPPGRRIMSWNHAALRDLPELIAIHSWLNELNDDGVLRWRNLPKLEGLEIGTSRLTVAGFRHLSGFAAIRTINLNHSSCDDAALEQLARLPHLEGLGAEATPITGSGLKHLTVLKSFWQLGLNNTSVDDAAVEDLGKLKSLKQLHLGGTKITPAAADKLRQALPGCKVATTPAAAP